MDFSINVSPAPRRCNRGWWGLAGLLVGVILTLLSFLLFRSCRGETAPPPPDDSPAVVDSTGEVTGPELPEGSGKSTPKVDTVYVVKQVPYWPDWTISYLYYRDGLLKLIALRKLLELDSVQARSQVYQVPEGFRLQIKGDSIIVDTFPHSVQTTVVPATKRKVLRVSGLAELDTQDGLGLGAELSLWRMVRLQGLVGIGRVCHEVGVTGFPANAKSPYFRLRLQIAVP